MTKLEQAALAYLKTLESEEGSLAEVFEAGEELKSAAILWAQEYSIFQAQFQRSLEPTKETK